MKCPYCNDNANFYTDRVKTWNSNDVLVVSCSRCDTAIGCTVDIDDKVNEVTKLLAEISKGIESLVDAIERLG